LTLNLGAGPKDLESLRSHVTSRFLADNDTSLLESEDSNYVNKYKEETEDKGVKHKGVKVVDFDKGSNRDRSDNK
jgi:hypothetical protein